LGRKKRAEEQFFAFSGELLLREGNGKTKNKRIIMKSLYGCALLILANLTLRAADYTQEPGHFGGFDSFETFAVADEFVLSQDTTISLINWWGNSISNPPQNLKIRLFSDNEGQPGTLLFESSNESILKARTGNFVNRAQGPHDRNLYPEYQYTLILRQPFQAQAGVKYWLSVVGDSGSQWLWEASGSQENLGVQRSIFADPIYGPWTPYYDNTAFAIGPVLKQRSGRQIHQPDSQGKK
jgi:hypothetical protein